MGGGVVITAVREECLRAGSLEARTKPGASLKQVERIPSLVANALMTPSESTRSDSWQLAAHTWTPSVSLRSRSSQHEILEDYAELFSLFGWQRYTQS